MPLRVELLEVLDVRILKQVVLNGSDVGLQRSALLVNDTRDRVVAVLARGVAGPKLIHDAVAGVREGLL